MLRIRGDKPLHEANTLDDLRALMGSAPVRDDPAFDPPLDACALHADQPTDPKS
jgi:hypothetical protein